MPVLIDHLETLLKKTVAPEDLFGQTPEAFHRNYRKFVSIAHPDIHPTKRHEGGAGDHLAQE